MRIEITKANGTHVFDLFPTTTPANLDGLDLMTARSHDHEFFAVYAQGGGLEIIGWIEAKGGKAGEGKGRREFRAIRRDVETGAAYPGQWEKTRKGAVSSLEAAIRIHAENADRAARTMNRAETRAANLAAITEEFRTVEVMTGAGVVYITAGFAEANPEDGTVSQDVTAQGGKVIGRVIRSGRDEFHAVAANGEISETVIDQRAAMAILALDAYAPEVIETEAAAEALTAATAERTAARVRQDRAETAAERSASRAAMAATLAHQAAAEALDAGSEATRLALLVKPGADAAEVEDAAGAAIAAADAAARSAGQAKAAAELAAAYAAEALEIAQGAPEAPQASTGSPEAPEAVSGPSTADQADIWPSEAIDQGRATETRWTAGQRVRFDYVGQPEPAFGTVEADTEMGASNVPVRMDSGSRVLVAWNGPQAV